MKTLFITLLIGAAGALAAAWLNIPAPFLTGPAIFVSLAGVAGISCDIPVRLRDVGFVVIGIILGASVTPEALSAAATWPASLIAMCTAVAAIMLAGGFMLATLFNIDRKTALLASSPGHLSYVLGFSTDIGADTAVISVIQSVRVLILTLMVPITIAVFTDADMSMQPTVGKTLSIFHLMILIVLAAVLGMGLKKFSVPAAYLLGGMIMSSLGHGFGLTPGVMPQNLSIGAFIGLGTLIGTRFSGVNLQVLAKSALGGVALTLLALVISIAAAVLVAQFTDLPLTDLVIAFSPGGLETMIAMGVVLGADPTFVAFHHVARLLFLSLFVPVALALKPRRRKAPRN